MWVAWNEIEKVEKLEDEREYKNSIDKLSIVKMTHWLQGIMERWEKSNAKEKIILSSEMAKLRDSLQDREKWLNKETQQMRNEKDELMERITGLDLNDREDIEKMSSLINDLR